MTPQPLRASWNAKSSGNRLGSSVGAMTSVVGADVVVNRVPTRTTSLRAPSAGRPRNSEPGQPVSVPNRGPTSRRRTGIGWLQLVEGDAGTGPATTVASE